MNGLGNDALGFGNGQDIRSSARQAWHVCECDGCVPLGVPDPKCA